MKVKAYNKNKGVIFQMINKLFLAHISADRTRTQILIEHLYGTGRLAGKFANAFECKEQGEKTGQLHDLGKGTSAFQQRLFGGPRVDHSTAGAREIYDKRRPSNIAASYCIAGHHAGLPDGGTGADSAGISTLQGRLRKELDDYSDFLKQIEIQKLPPIPMKPLGKGGFSFAFYTRMLFSCLVDADYLDTEEFMSKGMLIRPESSSMNDLLVKLEKHVEPWLQNTDGNTVNGRRTEILKACLEKGKAAQGLYQLTVPTGGGKTVSSLAFALKHAVEHNLERVIYVIPYTSIIEQNADVFRNIVGIENVLEDHCNVSFESPDELDMHRLAAENYDKRVIVTTNVQFFESLFSNKPFKCRKLHNFAKSVIIFDEAQMLPADYLLPCVRAISELIYNYHCTAVLCTATQPALMEYFPKEISESMQELCPDVKGQYEFFKRTQVENKGEIAECDLIDFIKMQNQILCILNRRKSVRSVYEQLKEQHVSDVFHLSTWMYPEHRKRVLKQIRESLSKKQPCRVVATSLIEAGVDVDFPTVWRELAGIDSIIQAAGRCNREGKLAWNQCKTTFFTIKGETSASLSSGIKQPISVAEQIVRKYEDIAEHKAIQEYFRRLYKFKGDGLDKKDIVANFEDGVRTMSFPFETIAKAFRLIEEDTKTVLIPLEEKAQKIAQSLQSGGYSRQLMRDAGHYCVNVYAKDYQELQRTGGITEIFEGFALLEDINQYSEECGLMLNKETGIGVYY